MNYIYFVYNKIIKDFVIYKCIKLNYFTIYK